MEISIDLVEKLGQFPLPKVIAVSGFGGSGKSTFARALGLLINAPVVGVDSFQKVGAFNTAYSLWTIMDFLRLEKEVLIPFMRGDSKIQYGQFDAQSEKISETVEFENHGQLIVEGVGLFRPELLGYFAYKIWVDCPLETAIARGKKRDREEYNNPTDELWDGIWKENDLQYFSEYKPKETADIVFSNP